MVGRRSIIRRREAGDLGAHAYRRGILPVGVRELEGHPHQPGTGKRDTNSSDGPRGSVMTVEFDLDGHSFTALNGGPPSRSARPSKVRYENQEEIDYFWDAPGAGGGPKPRQCGWLKSRLRCGDR